MEAFFQQYWWLTFIPLIVLVVIKWEAVMQMFSGPGKAPPPPVAEAPSAGPRVSKRVRAELIREDAGESLAALDDLEQRMAKENAMTKGALDAGRSFEAKMISSAISEAAKNSSPGT